MHSALETGNSPTVFDRVAAELRRLGITLAGLPGEDRVNFRNGADGTARMAETLDEAVKAGRSTAVDHEIRGIGLPYLSILALVVGVATGFGAVAFRDLIGLIHNVLFLGQFAVRYDANVFTPTSPWGVLVILVPVLGALAVTFLVTKFAPEARGHGVPEVMDAI